MRMSDIVSHAGLAFYPQVALVLFLLAFAIVLVRTFLPAAQPLWERAGRMALDDPNDDIAARVAAHHTAPTREE
jgi:hypothetical protein